MHRSHLLFSLGVMLLASAAARAEPALYETGPSEVSSYVRFVNATTHALAVTSSKGGAKIELGTQDKKRVSRFYRVKAGSKMTATLHGNGHQVSVSVTGKPWEYITIAALPSGRAGIKAVPVRETPEDFNAMRASLSLFNLDAGCKPAAMRGGPKNVPILTVAPFSIKRRLINPVKLTANITCDGKQAQTTLDIPQMQAGERYSVFLYKTGARHAFITVDGN